jgi:hypothetical protein
MPWRLGKVMVLSLEKVSVESGKAKDSYTITKDNFKKWNHNVFFISFIFNCILS